MWNLDLDLQATLTAGLQIIITPPANVTFAPPSGTLNGSFQANLTAKGQDAQHPLIVFGQAGGSRIQTDSFALGAGLTITWNSAAAKAIAATSGATSHMRLLG